MTLSWTSLASTPPKAPADFKNILVDVRNSRGGNGDVAAGYLTALDLVERKGVAAQRITLLTDAKGKRILESLTGHKIKDGQTITRGIRVHSSISLPSTLPTVDLYLQLASVGGYFNNSGDFWNRSRMPSGELMPPGFIPISDDSILVAQTVLGNTENRNSSNPYGLIQKGDHQFDLMPAGLAPSESGIYRDPLAAQLRGASQEEVKRFLTREILRIEDVRDRARLQDLINGNKLKGRRSVGLVYGISDGTVKTQFESYLAGWVDSRPDRPLVLVTPSSFDPVDDLQSTRLRQAVTVIGGDAALPEKALPGHIYVIRTKTLPHPVFVGLMAYSEVPPIIAGDGALSAVITLGKPFAMTQVGWNRANAQNLSNRLTGKTTGLKSTGSVIEKVFDERDLSASWKMDDSTIKKRFRLLRDRVPRYVTDSILEAVQGARLISDQTPTPELLASIRDPAFRLSVITTRANSGDAHALQALAENFDREPMLIIKELARHRIRQETLKQPVVLRVVKKKLLEPFSAENSVLIADLTSRLQNHSAIGPRDWDVLRKNVAQALLQPADRSVSSNALSMVRKFPEIRGPEIERAMSQLLLSPNSPERNLWEILILTEKLKAQSPEMFHALDHLARHEAEHIRIQAYRSLAAFENIPESALLSWIDRLPSETPTVTANMIDLFARYRKKTDRVLVALAKLTLDSNPPDERLIEALDGEIDSKPLREFLVSRLHSSDQKKVRELAGERLAALYPRHPETEGHLIRWTLREEPASDTRKAALKMLASVAAQRPSEMKSPQTPLLLTEALFSPNTRTQFDAARYFTKGGHFSEGAKAALVHLWETSLHPIYPETERKLKAAGILLPSHPQRCDIERVIEELERLAR